MLYPYQIGKTAINWEFSNFRTQNSLYFEHSVSGLPETISPRDSSRVLYANKQFIYEPQRAVMEGVLFSGLDQHIESLIGQLMSIINTPTTLIAFFIMDEVLPEQICNCINPCTHRFMWFQAQCILQNAVIVPRGLNENPALRLEFSYVPIWQPLDPYIWHYGAVYPDLTVQEHVNNYDDFGFYPTIKDLTASATCCAPTWGKKLFTDTDKLDFYFPEYWEARFNNPARIKHIHYFEDVGTKDYDVYADSGIWSYSPFSLWGFSNLPSSGQIRIETTRTHLVFDQIIDPASIYLSEVDSDLSHDGGLTTDDLIIIGDVPYGQAFIIRRAGSNPPRILRNTDGSVYTPTVYGENTQNSTLAQSPAMLGVGRNKISVFSPYGANWAGYHVYRRA